MSNLTLPDRPARRSKAIIRNGPCHLYQVIARALKPRPSLAVSAWADRHRILTAISSGERGPWRTDRTPYLSEIMDALSTTNPCERVVMQFASQSGKSEVSLNWIGYIMHHAPGPMLIVHPTLEVRARWVIQRLNPMLSACPSLTELIDIKRKRDSTNTEGVKTYPGGILIMAGANSPSSLSSMPIRYVVCDEIDRFPANVGGEGDPIALIEQRTKTFPRRKTLLISTPTTKGSSRIERHYLQSDQRRYHVPCPHCATYQTLEWKHPGGRLGLSQIPGTDRIIYTCQACGADIEEHHKPAMLAAGQWIPKHPERPVRGYQLSGLYTQIGLGFTWAQLWSRWAAAQTNTENIKAFINTDIGEPYEEQNSEVNAAAIAARLETYPPNLPILARTGFVDVQKDRLELTICDWAQHEECWVHDHIILPGQTADRDVWATLEDELKPHNLDALGIDSGYNATQVYEFCKGKTWAYPTKGIPGMHRAIVQDQQARNQRLRKRRQNLTAVEPIGVDNAKALIYTRINLSPGGPGTIHWPNKPAFDQEYFDQIAAERLTTTVKDNTPQHKWVQLRARNEALDCLVGCLATLRTAIDLTRIKPRAERTRQNPAKAPTIAITDPALLAYLAAK